MLVLPLCLLLCAKAAWRPDACAAIRGDRGVLFHPGRCCRGPRSSWALHHCYLPGRCLDRPPANPGSHRGLRFGAVAGLSPLAAGALDYSPFVQADPMLFPLAVEVAAAAHAWVRTRPGNRGANGYVTAEEPPDPHKRPAAALGRQPKGEGWRCKGEAAHFGRPCRFPGYTARARCFFGGAGADLNRGSGEGFPSELPAAPARRATPLPVCGLKGSSACYASSRPHPCKEALGHSGPPACQSSCLAAGRPSAARPCDRAAAWHYRRRVARRALSEPLVQVLQAKAATSLVGQLAGSTPDSLIDLPASSVSTSTKGTTGRLKIQAELAQRDGSAAAGRRMDPTSVPGSSGQAQTNMAAYLERFGGYHKDRTIGLAQWQCALAMDLLAKGETKGAGDTLAMLMIFFEQVTLDGNPDLGWLMTHLADPPNGVFQDRTVTPTTSLRPFSPLAPRPPPKLPDAGAKQEEAAPTRKQLLAQLWAAKKSGAQA